MKGHKHLTVEQRREIVAIARLRTGCYPRYPLRYIAALYGVTTQWVSHLTANAGVPLRDRWHSGWSARDKPPANRPTVAHPSTM